MTDAPLRQRLDDKDESVRAFAAEDAGFDDRAEDITPLVDRLQRETSVFVRGTIVTALARMTHLALCDRVVSLLASDDAYLRSAGVFLLTARGHDAVETLERTFAGGDADVRKLLLDAASAIPSHAAERVLLLGLEDRDINVRIAAVEYLGDRTRADLKGHFEALVRAEREPMLLSAALSALEQVGDATSWAAIEERQAGPHPVPPFLAPLLLRAMGRWAREGSLARFFEEPPRSGTASLGDWLDALEMFHDRHGFRVLPAEHFGVLCTVLDACPSAVVRVRLLAWIGRLDRQPGVIDLLAGKLQSPDSTVRHGAALGLGRMATAEAKTALADRLALECDEDVRAAITGALSTDAGALP